MNINKNNYHYIPVLALTALILVLLTCKETIPQSLHLGDTVEQYGYSLSATAVEDPTTPGMFYKAKKGYKLVAVEIVVGNVSGETLSVSPLYTILVDSNGFVYELELVGRDGQLAAVHLNTGEKVKGWVAFEIPEDATPASIKYLVGTFSDKFLQVDLIE
jgi:hypothetical protein